MGVHLRTDNLMHSLILPLVIPLHPMLHLTHSLVHLHMPRPMDSRIHLVASLMRPLTQLLMEVACLGLSCPVARLERLERTRKARRTKRTSMLPVSLMEVCMTPVTSTKRTRKNIRRRRKTVVVVVVAAVHEKKAHEIRDAGQNAGCQRCIAFP